MNKGKEMNEGWKCPDCGNVYALRTKAKIKEAPSSEEEKMRAYRFSMEMNISGCVGSSAIGRYF